MKHIGFLTELSGTANPLFRGLCIAALTLSALSTGQCQEEAGGEQPAYPKAVTTSGEKIYVVDLDLPGVWEVGEERKLFVKGSKFLRKPMNRPHCATPHPSGGILVGDSATREVYWIEKAGADPKPLTNGYIGIPMALAVDPTGKFVFVGDAEKRATFRLSIEGGKCELVARVNARGFAFDNDGKLLAVTPDAEAIQRIDTETGDVETLVGGRPYQFPNSLCWAGDQGFVTDTYDNSVWRFTADGKTERWHQGAPLQRPVGIATSGTSLFVADPKQKQIFEFNLETKEFTPRM
ncbi:hypothetical protein OAF09_02045 [bacterium]|nr:hypothetical protein [bacterium]